jgi:hypothetical protein
MPRRGLLLSEVQKLAQIEIRMKVVMQLLDRSKRQTPIDNRLIYVVVVGVGVRVGIVENPEACISQMYNMPVSGGNLRSPDDHMLNLPALIEHQLLALLIQPPLITIFLDTQIFEKCDKILVFFGDRGGKQDLFGRGLGGLGFGVD